MATATEQTNANNLELNKGDQFIFAIDVSASMQTKDCPGNLSRIEYTKEQLGVFATEAAKYDEDGADYYTFGESINGGQPRTAYESLALDKAQDLIKNLKATEGATDTAGAISTAWTRAQELRAKGCTENIVLMIVTDGAPSDRDAVKTTIRSIADSLQNGEEFGITFLTVGNIDAGLDAFLKDLDDNLNAKHDIVDVKDFLKVNFIQAFSGAVHD
jgi:hypothetical protein